MIKFEYKERPKVLEICKQLILSNEFEINTMKSFNLKALIMQLIKFCNLLLLLFLFLLNLIDLSKKTES